MRSRVIARFHGRLSSSLDATTGPTVMPMPTASMRLLEYTIASAAIGAAILLGLAR